MMKKLFLICSFVIIPLYVIFASFSVTVCVTTSTDHYWNSSGQEVSGPGADGYDHTTTTSTTTCYSITIPGDYTPANPPNIADIQDQINDAIENIQNSNDKLDDSIQVIGSTTTITEKDKNGNITSQRTFDSTGINDPVKFSTGNFSIENEEDLSINYINSKINILRSYLSSFTSSHSFGNLWNFNYDTRIIKGVKPNAENEYNQVHDNFLAINEYYNNAQNTVDLINDKIEYLNGKISDYDAAIAGIYASGFASYLGSYLSMAQANKELAIGYKDSLLEELSTAEQARDAILINRDKAEDISNLSYKELLCANNNQSRNLYVINSSDPEYMQYTGNDTVTLIDELGASHLYILDTTPDLTSTVTFLDGSINYYPQGITGTSAIPDDNKLKMLSDGSYILTKKDLTQYIYSFYGQLLKIIDTNQNEITFGYNVNHLLSEITDDFNRQIKIEKDTKGRIIKITDPKDRITLYEYDDYGYLSKVTDSQGDSVRYKYENNLITEIIKPDNSSRKYHYQEIDGKMVVISNADEEGYQDYYDYNFADKYTISTNDAGGYEKYYYNEKLQTVKIEHKDGTYVSMEYNENDNLVKKIDELGREYTYQYDNNRNMIEAKDPDGNVEKWGFNQFNKVSSYTNKSGDETVYTYDTNGNLLTISYPDGAKINYEYNSQGLVIKATDQNNHEKQFEYDNYGYIAKIIDPEGNTKSFDNDIIGNIEKQTDALDNITQFQYNNDNKVIKTIDNLGYIETFTYNNRKDLVETVDKNGNKTTSLYNKRHDLIKITKPNGDMVEYVYSPTQKIKEVILNGINHTEYQYDLRDRLTSIIQNELNITNGYEYDAVGNITAKINGEGNRTEYIYDNLDRLSEVLNPDGTQLQNEYDLNGNLTVKTNEAGNKTYYDYDIMNRLIQSTDAENNIKVFTYDNKGNLISQKDPNNNTEQFFYNKNDKIIKAIDALNNSIIYQYDPRGLLIAKTDKRGYTFHYQYDPLGRMTKQTDPLNNSKDYSYDANSNLISQKDENENITQFEYDVLNRVTAKIDPYNNITTYSYNYMDQIEKVTDPLNNATIKAYDELARLIKETDPLGESKTYRYNKINQLISVTDELGRIKAYSYDNRGRKIEDINNLGEKITYEYDTVGNLIKQIDAKNNEYQYEYDKINRLIKETNQLNNNQTYSYDKNGNLITKIDFNGKETLYEYDGLNRLTKTLFSDGTRKEINYDQNNNIIRAENDNKWLEYEYNALNKIMKETDPDLNQVVNYAYDKAGNKVETSWLNDSRKIRNVYGKINELIKVIDPENGITEYTYDADGREIKKTAPNDVITETKYDAAGRVTFIKNYQDKHHGHNKLLNSYAYLYNAAGERTHQIDEKGDITAYQYDEIGRIKTVYYPFNNGKKQEDFKERLYLGLYPVYEKKNGKGINDYRFDLPQISIPDFKYNDFQDEIKNCLKDSEEFYKIYNKYDKNAAGKWHIKQGEGATEFISKIDYDTETELKLKAAYQSLNSDNRYFDPDRQWMWTESFTYDENSNRISKANGWGKINYSYDNANQILNAGNRKYSFDLNGNQIKESLGELTANYQYNPENRVVDIYSETNGLICKDNWKLKNGVSYEYDAFGRRVTSADYSITNSKKQWSAETNRNFLYDGQSFNLLAEFYDTEFKDHGHHWGWYKLFSKHNPVSEYIYGNNKIIERTDFGKSDKWFGDLRCFKYADKTYYAQDILGSTVLLTGTHGQAVEEYAYDAFGNNFEGTFLKRNEIGYNGKLFDPTIRLYDYGYRDYAPVIGRWISVDPVKDGGNWYLYCGNDPMNWVDMWGLWINNGDGTFVAEQGDTLWGLQTETGRDLNNYDFTRDPKTLQIGETVNVAPTTQNNNSPTIDSNKEAIDHYYKGNGESVNLGPKTQDALKNSPDQKYREERIKSGATPLNQGNYKVDITKDVFHVGKTVVEYYTTHGTKYGVTTFTGFVRDGFWDILPGKGDGKGPKNELPGGKPYAYNPYSWNVSYSNQCQK